MLKSKNSRGFTLMELVVVSTTLVFIAFAIYATFNSGIKIWQRIERGSEEEDVNIFFAKLANDLRNVSKFSGMEFYGKEDEARFITLVTSNKLSVRTVGDIRYAYDNTDKAVKRYISDFSDIYSSADAAGQKLLQGVSYFKFTYYVYDKQMKRCEWLDEWVSPDELPSAVKTEIEINHNEKKYQFTRTIGIPAGN